MRLQHINIFILFCLVPIVLIGQTNTLSVFDNLVNKTWIAEGQWENNGPKFKQEVSFQYDLEHSIIVADSKGFINEEQTKYGHRNHGIRQYDKGSDTIKFWEFDVFGNVTKGVVTAEGKNIIYQYSYGDTLVTDMWEYVDDATYNFKVGSYVNGKWEQIYLNTVFKEKR